MILPTPRMEMPGANGLVLVEWLGDEPLTIQTTERQYLFTTDRRRLYMTAGDYAMAAAHVEGIVLTESAAQLVTP